jgi:hypothetical protein
MPAKFCMILLALIFFFTGTAHARRIKLDGLLQDSLVKNLTQKILELKITGLTLTEVRFVQQRAHTLKVGGKELTELTAFCLIAVSVRTVPRSLIRIERWLQQKNWNGFAGYRHGGLAGSIAYNGLAAELKQG